MICKFSKTAVVALLLLRKLFQIHHCSESSFLQEFYLAQRWQNFELVRHILSQNLFYQDDLALLKSSNLSFIRMSTTIPVGL